MGFLESVALNEESDVHFSAIKGYYNTEIICTKNVHIANYEYLTKFWLVFHPPREANDRRSKIIQFILYSSYFWTEWDQFECSTFNIEGTASRNMRSRRIESREEKNFWRGYHGHFMRPISFIFWYNLSSVIMNSSK